MSNDLITFTWHVPDGGFLWVDATTRATEGRPARVLVEGTSGFIACRRYDPLTEHPALFRTFAETPPTEEGILAFANRWGGAG
jgi:hypothetical protein